MSPNKATARCIPTADTENTDPNSAVELLDLVGKLKLEMSGMTDCIDRLLVQLRDKDDQLKTAESNYSTLQTRYANLLATHECTCGCLKRDPPADVVAAEPRPEAEQDESVKPDIVVALAGSVSTAAMTTAKEESKAEDGSTVKIEESIGLAGKEGDIDRKDYSVMSIEQEILRDITNGKDRTTRMNLTRLMDCDMSGFKESEDGEFRQKMSEFMKKCPYIDKLRQDSDKYRAAISLLQTLAVYSIQNSFPLLEI